MSTKPTEVKALVEGGKATPGPPLGPALGPLRVNVSAVIAEINKVTSSYAGMTVPIVVKVFPGKPPTFEVVVKTPSTSALLKKAAGVEKGSGAPNTEPVGDVDFKALIEVAEGKKDSMLGKTMKAVVKEVIGTAMSTGITIEGKSAKEVLQEVNEGKYDSYFK
ncbi:MAG: 50S ribosomal protein L11 [Candidatus Hodarchaeales archaeon]